MQAMAKQLVLHAGHQGRGVREAQRKFARRCKFVWSASMRPTATPSSLWSVCKRIREDVSRRDDHGGQRCNTRDGPGAVDLGCRGHRQDRDRFGKCLHHAHQDRRGLSAVVGDHRMCRRRARAAGSRVRRRRLPHAGRRRQSICRRCRLRDAGRHARRATTSAMANGSSRTGAADRHAVLWHVQPHEPWTSMPAGPRTTAPAKDVKCMFLQGAGQGNAPGDHRRNPQRCAYVGASRLKDLSKCTTFVIRPRPNVPQWESLPD